MTKPEPPEVKKPRKPGKRHPWRQYEGNPTKAQQLEAELKAERVVAFHSRMGVRK